MGTAALRGELLRLASALPIDPRDGCKMPLAAYPGGANRARSSSRNTAGLCHR